jgi:hypothetical protein
MRDVSHTIRRGVTWRVQKLARRTPELMQINIAAHQVNVAQNQG